MGANEAQIILLVLAVLAVPGLAFAALQAWAVWLVRRNRAPRWAKWVLPAAIVAPIVGVVVGFVGSFKAVAHVAPADKATILAASISEGMNAGAFFCFPLPLLWFGVLAFFTLRGPAKPGSA